MHAVLLEASYERGRGYLPPTCQNESADVIHFAGSRMGIDEVRTLIREAYLTPLVAPERSFVLAYPAFTEEAQNALLKLLEEPPRTAQFFIITERPQMLLATLRSRLVLVDVPHEAEDLAEYASFARLSYGERLALIGKYTEKKDDVSLTKLMEYIEVWAHTHKDREVIAGVLAFKQHFHSPGASRKMILEHLALLLPPHTTAK